MLKNQLLTMISAWKANPYTRWQAADQRNGYDRIARQIGEAAKHTVLSGPYQGMKYFGPEGVPAVDRHATTKFLGSFEAELHPWIETLIKESFGQIVHIGSADGYHPVGMAMRCRESSTIVFDTLIAARKACKTLAKQNGVHDRIQLRGFCGTEGLLDVDLEGSLVFSDCGGAEFTILDKMLYPGFRLATILVELHDAFDARVTPRLMSRFSGTHSIEFVSAKERIPADYPLLDGFPIATAKLALDENRSVASDGKPQAWALLRPYSS